MSFFQRFENGFLHGQIQRLLSRPPLRRDGIRCARAISAGGMGNHHFAGCRAEDLDRRLSLKELKIAHGLFWSSARDRIDDKVGFTLQPDLTDFSDPETGRDGMSRREDPEVRLVQPLGTEFLAGDR